MTTTDPTAPTTAAPPTHGESLDLRGLVMDYGGERPAVDIESLAIEAGEFVSLVGPSGCGKTTTIRAISGLISPTRGDILVGGRRVNDLPVQKRKVGMVFQNYALYPNMTVRRNVEYSLRKRGDGKRARAKRVSEVAALLGIERLLERKPRQLSGGEQQRVALGRALAKNPSLFLLDEPLSNLDAKLRGQMRKELIRLHARVRSTIVYVTHDQLEAMTMSHRIAIMSEGRVQQFDTPANVYSRPANRFVAGFVGQPNMNVLDGELISDRGQIEVATALGRIRLGHALAATLTAQGSADSAVTLGIRPEHLTVASPTAGDATGGRVTMVENVGAEQFVSIECGGVEVVTRLESGHAIATGETASVRVDPAKVHLFGADGEAIRPETLERT